MSSTILRKANMHIKMTKLLGLNDKRRLRSLGFLALSSGFLLSFLLSNKRMVINMIIINVI